MNILEMAMAAKMGGGKGGGVSSWDELGKKQAFEPIEYLPYKRPSYVKFDLEGSTYYKISDNLYDDNTLNDSVVTCPHRAITAKLEKKDIDWDYNVSVFVAESSPDPNSEAGNPYFALSVVVNRDSITERGVYIHINAGLIVSEEDRFIITKETITPIPEEYLPNTVLTHNDLRGVKLYPTRIDLTSGEFSSYSYYGELSIEERKKYLFVKEQRLANLDIKIDQKMYNDVTFSLCGIDFNDVLTGSTIISDDGNAYIVTVDLLLLSSAPDYADGAYSLLVSALRISTTNV